MLFPCLCILGGAYSLGLCRTMPADDLFLAMVMLAALTFRTARLRAVGWFIIGFVTMWAGAWLIIDDRLKPAMQGQTIALVARVADFPGTAAGSIRFIVEQELRPDLPSRIRLSWYEPAVVPLPGEVWRLRVRLRQPYGYSNPGGFDYEGWLFRQRIGATGYVVSQKDNQRQSTIQVVWLARIRQYVVDRVTRLLPDDDAAAVLLAISVGARHRITREQWSRYAVTGTSHLMAISGLHIGLATGGVLALAWIFLTLVCPRRNVRDMALLAAVVAAGLYASVSGFAVPACRAFLMALLAAAAVMLWRRPVAATLLSVPCLVLFLRTLFRFMRPVSSCHLAPSQFYSGPHRVTFARLQYQGALPWLSVSAICVALGHCRSRFSPGCSPLTVLIFGRFSGIAPLMNLLVLPIFNFVTVPFCLAGMILGGPL
jgi:competence protein ComEC